MVSKGLKETNLIKAHLCVMIHFLSKASKYKYYSMLSYTKDLAIILTSHVLI